LITKSQKLHHNNNGQQQHEPDGRHRCPPQDSEVPPGWHGAQGPVAHHGWAVQLRTTQPELKHRFEKEGLLAAAEKYAKKIDVAIIQSDE
jgi:hypothetical protein